MERKDYEAIADNLDKVHSDLFTREASKAIRDLCLMVWGSQERMFEDVRIPDGTTADSDAGSNEP